MYENTIKTASNIKVKTIEKLTKSLVEQLMKVTECEGAHTLPYFTSVLVNTNLYLHSGLIVKMHHAITANLMLSVAVVKINISESLKKLISNVPSPN